MEGELICNFRKCRKPIKSDAWVTSCSHIFCPEDGDREFNKSLTCPACNTKLNGKFDIIKMDTNPNEKYKAIILAGLNPETILEIASRALSFWNYQIQQELAYGHNMAAKYEEQRNQIEELHKQMINKYQMEMNNMSKELESSKLEVIGQKQRSAELSEKLMEKSRQLQKVQTMYENLRRKCISPLNNVFEQQNELRSEGTLQRKEPPNRQNHFELPLKAPDMFKIHGSRSSLERNEMSEKTSFDHNFVFFANESCSMNEQTNLAAAAAVVPPHHQFTDFTNSRN